MKIMALLFTVTMVMAVGLMFYYRRSLHLSFITNVDKFRQLSSQLTEHNLIKAVNNSNNNNNLPSPQPVCGFHVFRDFLRRAGSSHLPGSGFWTRHRRLLTRFHPDLCSLPYGPWLPGNYLADCLARTLSVSYIVVVGDSNAWRFVNAVRRSFSEGRGTSHSRRSFHCGQFMSDTWSNASSRLFSNETGCRIDFRHVRYFTSSFRCRLPACDDVIAADPVGRRRCVTTSQPEVVVRYLAATGDLLTSDAIFDATSTGCWRPDVLNVTGSRFVSTKAETYQEFLFREYFAADPQPDLVIHLSSSWEHSSLSGYASQVDRFVDLLRRQPLPSRTRLLVVSKPDECVRLKPAPWNETMYEDGKLTRTQWIDAANHILHSRLVPLFLGDADKQQQQQQQLLLFPDIAQAMRPVIDEIAIDGVHSHAFWYRLLWSYILQTLCNTQNAV